MTYVPITPFRGTVTKGLLANAQLAQDAETRPRADKWEVLRELGVAGSRLGVTDRQLTVLQALLSFYPATDLGAEDASIVVFPSNRSICDRLNGMPCSTMRRHLAGLLQAGLIIRRDSPNGKRYSNRQGDSFGFDLSPLSLRFAEICALAEIVRVDQERVKRLRQSVSLMRRDLAALVAYGAETRPDVGFWDAFSDLAILSARDLRRHLSEADLEALYAKLESALDDARDVLEADNLSINGANNEQHCQNSNTNQSVLEPCFEKAKGNVWDQNEPVAREETADQELPNMPLGLVLAVCAEIAVYSAQPIRHWHDLVRAADQVRPMMGISSSAWSDAMEAMGPEQAAVVVAAMLERFGEIQSPGGYLRHLARKAADGQFSCGPMVMALMRKDAA